MTLSAKIISATTADLLSVTPTGKALPAIPYDAYGVSRAVAYTYRASVDVQSGGAQSFGSTEWLITWGPLGRGVSGTSVAKLQRLSLTGFQSSGASPVYPTFVVEKTANFVTGAASSPIGQVPLDSNAPSPRFGLEWFTGGVTHPSDAVAIASKRTIAQSATPFANGVLTDLEFDWRSQQSENCPTLITSVEVQPAGLLSGGQIGVRFGVALGVNVTMSFAVEWTEIQS